mmetsp:Transcript_25279/g.53313  ORF Transcript_25279/g.53313 Transcript_25279/m.53313 type:complete len:107 (-) Transcript_25279:965-1285(-)
MPSFIVLSNALLHLYIENLLLGKYLYVVFFNQNSKFNKNEIKARTLKISDNDYSGMHFTHFSLLPFPFRLSSTWSLMGLKLSPRTTTQKRNSQFVNRQIGRIQNRG